MSATDYVDRYLAAHDGSPPSLDRLVTTPTGLDAPGILDVIGDTRLGPHVLEVLADLMHPTDSLYYDAIYGAYNGQAAIRGWLLPTMAQIDFIEFVPQGPTELFADGGGATSVDEWQMIAVLDGERVPLPKGVSVRRYADGWISWNCDVYDTGPFRMPPSDDAPAPDLPPVPQTDWTTVGVVLPPELSPEAQAWLARRAASSSTGDVTTVSGLANRDIHDVLHHASLQRDAGLIADLMHPEGSLYVHPLFGEARGQSAIRSQLVDVMGATGDGPLEAVGPSLFNGAASALEWLRPAHPDSTAGSGLRGTSVRRYRDGWITYAADYFDTASIATPTA